MERLIFNASLLYAAADTNIDYVELSPNSDKISRSHWISRSSLITYCQQVVLSEVDGSTASVVRREIAVDEIVTIQTYQQTVNCQQRSGVGWVPAQPRATHLKNSWYQLGGGGVVEIFLISEERDDWCFPKSSFSGLISKTFQTSTPWTQWTTLENSPVGDWKMIRCIQRSL